MEVIHNEKAELEHSSSIITRELVPEFRHTHYNLGRFEYLEITCHLAA